MTAKPFPERGPQHRTSDEAPPVLPPDLTEEDRAEIGRLLVELLFGLHQSAALHPAVIDDASHRGLDIALRVPGTGDVLASLRLVNSHYELSVSANGCEEVPVLHESDGRLAELYRYYFASREEHQREAKDRFVRGLRQLMLVNDWGVRHYQYT